MFENFVRMSEYDYYVRPVTKVRHLLPWFYGRQEGGKRRRVPAGPAGETIPRVSGTASAEPAVSRFQVSGTSGASCRKKEKSGRESRPDQMNDGSGCLFRTAPNAGISGVTVQQQRGGAAKDSGSAAGDCEFLQHGKVLL